MVISPNCKGRKCKNRANYFNQYINLHNMQCMCKHKYDYINMFMFRKT